MMNLMQGVAYWVIAGSLVTSGNPDPSAGVAALVFTILGLVSLLAWADERREG